MYILQTFTRITLQSVEKIESIQRRATSYILNDFHHEMDYRTRLTKCELLPLSYRRSFLDLSFFMSTLLDSNCINFDTYFKFLPETRTRDDLTMSALTRHHRYTLFENYYFQRVVSVWNKLPYDTRELLVNLEEMTPAKTVIKKFLFQEFYAKFSTNMKCTWYIHCTCPNCKIT